MAIPEEYQEKVLAEATSATPNYDVDYNDERFGKVESDKNQALTELEQTYGGMIGATDKYYKDLSTEIENRADKMAQIQQENTDFAIEKIEQEKEKAQKDYIKEQSGAYVDWQKQSNQYGVNAEKMASAGLANTGYSESSQVSMYNTYQNRVATARETLNNIIINYNNNIKEAQLQNNAALAQIYADLSVKQVELALQGFQYKNQLVLEQANKKTELNQMYYNRYQDVLQQINTENAMAEEARRFNKNYELQVKQFNEQIRQYNQDYAEQVRQFNEEIARLKAKDAQENALEIQKLELAKQELAEEKRQFDEEMSYKQSVLAYEQSQGTVIPYTPSENVKNKINSLSLMKGQRGSETAIANSITAYCKQGAITVEDAEYMYKYFGYNPDDYLE
jgi:hypothetical protein